MDRNVCVIDIETLASCFTHTSLNVDTQEIKQFVIHEDLNELASYIEHLNASKGHITFNGNNFDYPVIHYILKNYKSWSQLSNQQIVELIYKEAQRIINLSHSGGFPSIREKDIIIPQLDLFLVNHYNNLARIQSLKGLEIAMNYKNVMDMPISHSRLDIKSEDIPSILEYNLNDVDATYKFFLLCKDKVELRKELSKIYNLQMTNWNDVKIGENIFLKLLSEDMKIPSYELRKFRTIRNEIKFKDIILDYIKFDNPKLQDLLEEFKDIIITQTKNGFKKSLDLHNQIFEYGQGGLHQCCKSGIYISNENTTILDIDVKSFYPNIAVQNKFRPEHLGESFTKIYSDIYKKRSIIPKSDPRNGAYKLMLNGCFGKAGDENSFLFDNEFLLRITVNGQLLLSMLIDKLLVIPTLFFCQSNTDGISIRVDNKYLDEVYSICKEWEGITFLELEYAEYSKMIIRDVNNYGAIYKDGKIKLKGAFEIDVDYHKNSSKRIVSLALANYYLNNIKPEDTINNHFSLKEYNIPKKENENYQAYGLFDFCIGSKMKGGNKLYSRELKGFEFIDTELSKTNRYIVSKEGVELIKKLPALEKNKLTETEKYKLKFDKNQMDIFDIVEDVRVEPEDRESNLEVGFKCQVLNILNNEYEESIINNIDKQYYIAECYKIIDKIK